jgi:glyoxylate reductase
MSRILVTRQIPQPAIELLRQAFTEVEVFAQDRNMTSAEIMAAMQDCEVLLCMLTNPIDKAVMDSNPKLIGICNYAVGYNNIDVANAFAKGIIVCNTPEVLTETTADLTWALIMSASRRIVEGDCLMRKGGFPGWEPMLLLGRDVYQKTLGIIGMGRIGIAVAKRACGFGMRIIYYKASGVDDHLPFEAEYVTLETLLKDADIVTIHAPLTPATKHLIGERELNLMKQTAVLINTARGAIIDEKALVKALKTGKIFAAGLDVFENEPALEEGLADLPNVVLLPHIGSASIETRTNMALLAAENAIAIIKGTNPPARVMLR